jgi:hypothetical protein
MFGDSHQLWLNKSLRDGAVSCRSTISTVTGQRKKQLAYNHCIQTRSQGCLHQSYFSHHKASPISEAF